MANRPAHDGTRHVAGEEECHRRRERQHRQIEEHFAAQVVTEERLQSRGRDVVQRVALLREIPDGPLAEVLNLPANRKEQIVVVGQIRR